MNKHSKHFSVVKRYFDKKLYDKDDVKLFVENGRITEDEYFEITGEKYTK